MATIDGDRPISKAEDDRLGFAPVARHLATAILNQPAASGLVFGIEGRWGSGKSTLINLTTEALKQSGATAPEVVEFSPWLVGDRDGLLQALFNDLVSAAIKIDPIALPEDGAQKISPLCQRRSKNRPLWRSKTRPVSTMDVEARKAPSRGPFLLHGVIVVSLAAAIVPV